MASAQTHTNLSSSFTNMDPDPCHDRVISAERVYIKGRRIAVSMTEIIEFLCFMFSVPGASNVWVVQYVRRCRPKPMG